MITNRTQRHIDRLKRLSAKGWTNLSSSEKAEYRDYAAYGAYNYTDLNRVESAVAELAGKLGLSLVTKTNWTVWDDPTKAEMERYLSNVVAIRDACPSDEEQYPPLPSSMEKLSYVDANNIEETLEIAYRVMNVAYLYNGEKLPRIPENYTHAMIFEVNAKKVLLLSSSADWRIDGDIEALYARWDSTVTMAVTRYTLDSDGKTWGDRQVQLVRGDQMYSYFDWFVWSSFDLINENFDEVFIEASDPVPVYE